MKPLPAPVRSALVACLLVAAVGQAAASQVAEYELKAEFLERFTRFVDWPAGTFADDQVPFVIGLWAENPFGPYLERIASTQPIKSRPVRIRQVAGLPEIEGCHMLFVPQSRRGDVRRILRHVGSKPILLVGDGQGFAELGLHIAFVPEGDRVRFEINESAAHDNGLKISAKLLKLARVVNGED